LTAGGRASPEEVEELADELVTFTARHQLKPGWWTD